MHRHQAQRIVVMFQMNRTNRRSIRKVAQAAGARLFGILLAFGPTASAQPATTSPVVAAAPGAAPTTAPANRLVANGVGADGQIRLSINKTVVIPTTPPH